MPMNMGLGSFSFSSSLPGSGCAPSGARARANNTEHASVRLVIEILDVTSVSPVRHRAVTRLSDLTTAA